MALPSDSPAGLEIKNYFYHLPGERIALFPAAVRDESALLVYRKSTQPYRETFKNIASLLPPDSLLLLNDTRVIHARLLFRKPGGATIEIFCLNPLTPEREYALAFGQASPVVWECLTGNARRWKEEPLHFPFSVNGKEHLLSATRALPGSFDAPPPQAPNHAIRFSWETDLKFGEVLEKAGMIPLPPYIHRDNVASDNDRYQTSYAHTDGSVAAPTAGLHFTPGVFSSLNESGIPQISLTLHVGAGTFRPVSSQYVGDHRMHAETFEISRVSLEQMAAFRDKTFVAVGTTTVRTLESLFWGAVKLARGSISEHDFAIGQWDPYTSHADPPFTRAQALEFLIERMDRMGMVRISGQTSLLIAPPYRYRMTDAMITNFHQPGSTLLLLVAAFLGDEWRRVYDFALKENFRFLSYGDTCLFLP